MNISKRKYSLFFWALVSFTAPAVTGCSNMLFFPMKPHIQTPEKFGIKYSDIYLERSGKPTLHSWWLPANTKKPKGSILFLHGNAENISTHFINAGWLPSQGYNVLAIDYRGYGKSEGSPNLTGALQDIDAAFEKLISLTPDKESKIILFGQSIGGSLGLSFLGRHQEALKQVDGVVIDSSFDSYPGIAREKLNELWLTWPFQYPLSWLITDQFDPEKFIGIISPTPIIIFHSTEDPVIPYHHGEKLYAKASQPKHLVTTKTPHIGTFRLEEHRKTLLDWLSKL